MAAPAKYRPAARPPAQLPIRPSSREDLVARLRKAQRQKKRIRKFRSRVKYTRRGVQLRPRSRSSKDKGRFSYRGVLISASIGTAAALAVTAVTEPKVIPVVGPAIHHMILPHAVTAPHATTAPPATAEITVGGLPAATGGTAAQRAFINKVAPGAVTEMHATGVPAAVTIAQAADESAWGSAAPNNNLFGIKGTGNAGSASLPTQEFQNGAYVSIVAQFAAYTSWAASISAHDRLLSTAPVYGPAMRDRGNPDQFARDLTGTYATDPTYGTTLIDNFMRPFDLYKYDSR